MSLYDYQIGLQITAQYSDDEFYGIIQATMRLADTDNLEALKRSWPNVWKELQARYNAPEGKLPEDDDPPAPIVIRECFVDEET